MSIIFRSTRTLQRFKSKFKVNKSSLNVLINALLQQNSLLWSLAFIFDWKYVNDESLHSRLHVNGLLRIFKSKELIELRTHAECSIWYQFKELIKLRTRADCNFLHFLNCYQITIFVSDTSNQIKIWPYINTKITKQTIVKFS